MTQRPNLFEQFGGVSKLAAELEEPVSTVSSWKIVGRIPATKQRKVLAAAERLQIAISAEDLVFPMGRGCADGEALPVDRASEPTIEGEAA